MSISRETLEGCMEEAESKHPREPQGESERDVALTCSLSWPSEAG